MSGRKEKPPILWDRVTLILVGVLILLLIIALAVNWRAHTSQVGQLSAENASLREEIEDLESLYTEGQTMSEYMENNYESGQSNEGSKKGTSGSTDPYSTAPESTGELTAPETAAPETSEPVETEPEKLQTLDGISAGTEVSKSELDTDSMSKYFQSYEIKTTGASYKRINGQSYQENPNVKLSDLRYLKVLHYNFNHQIQVGEIIVNKGLADDVLSIFRELYDAEYEIQSMYLVDNYWTGDGVDSDSASIDENNTSAFNYRPAVGSGKLSNHAYGFAIDLNPQQNPYVSYSSGKAKWSHKNANDYIDRDTGLPHVITHEDTAFKIFKAHGFKWGGDWNNPKDYQHFEKKLY